MHFVLQGEVADITQAEANKLSRNRNSSSVLRHGDSALIDTMKALVNYAKAFDLEHRVKFMNAHISDIVDDTLSSK